MKIAKPTSITDPFAPDIDTALALSVVPDDFDFQTAGMDDCTSPETLHWCWQAGRRGMDYKRFRRDVTDWYEANQEDWSSFSTSRRIILTQYFCVPIDKQIEVASQEQIGEWGVDYHEASINCRNARGRRAGAFLYGVLGMAQLAPILQSVWQLIAQYTEYGIEGTTEGDPAGLFDYIESTEGTSYESNGFAEDSVIYPEGFTASLAVTAVMGILRDGAY